MEENLKIKILKENIKFKSEKREESNNDQFKYGNDFYNDEEYQEYSKPSRNGINDSANNAIDQYEEEEFESNRVKNSN